MFVLFYFIIHIHLHSRVSFSIFLSFFFLLLYSYFFFVASWIFFSLSIVLWKLFIYSIYDTFQSLCASFYWFILIIFISQRFLSFSCVFAFYSLSPSPPRPPFRFMFFKLSHANTFDKLLLGSILPAAVVVAVVFLIEWVTWEEEEEEKLIFKLRKCWLAQHLYIYIATAYIMVLFQKLYSIISCTVQWLFGLYFSIRPTNECVCV